MLAHDKLVARINELSKLSRERALTAEETDERQRLRAQFLLQFRESFRSQLDNTYVQQDDGAKVPIKDWHQAAFEGEHSAD